MIAALIFVFVILVVFQNYYWKRRNLPPGPAPMPFFGNLLEIRKGNHPDFYVKCTKKYGDIYTVWMGLTPLVCVNDIEAVNEHFLRDGETYTGRHFPKEMMEILKNGITGIVFTEGQLWREHRRFALSVFRDFGVGKNLMEEKILDEIVPLFEDIDADIDAGVVNHSITDHINVTIGSIINALIMGHKYRSKERRVEFFKIKHIIDATFKELAHGIALVFQFKTHMFKNWPYFGKFYKKITASRDVVMNYFKEKVAEKRATIDFDSDAPIEDYVEAYLRKQKALEDAGSPHYFDDEQLYGTMWDLWTAGQETTANTTNWCVVYLINHPEVQEKLQAELGTIVSPDQLVTNDQRNRTPYLNAVIAELQRLSNVIETNAIHRTTKDTIVHGYKIPEGTAIISHISSILYDERYFPEPYAFKPERFIDENGAFKQHPALIPFGVGKRSCLGEALAKMELYLVIANMFNRYKFSADPEKPVPLTRIMSGTINAAPYNCRIEKRF
uniref:CYtochrome P450 family n=1 Tax=Panagrellus redivivus TaxID=6233 RepID=A0A7E4W476_PANRE